MTVFTWNSVASRHARGVEASAEDAVASPSCPALVQATTNLPSAATSTVAKDCAPVVKTLSLASAASATPAEVN